MVIRKWRVFLFVFLLAVAGGFYYYQGHRIQFEKLVTETDDTEKYVKFNMEVYDKISKIYWNKSSDADLSNLFKLSIDKVFGTSTILTSQDRVGTENMIRLALTNATTTESKKLLVANVAQVVLYNIPPAGRNQLLSQKQEKAFRETVGNINPQSDLYADLGTKTSASSEEVILAAAEKIKELKNATSTEDKAKLEKVKYASEVLTDPSNKTLYDQAKIEPTGKFRKIGSTFYADLSQIAPTSLFEFVTAVDNASTTKNIDTLIIDFRGNIGGSLDFLPAFFGLFVGKDQYVFDLYQQGEYKTERTTQPKYAEFSRFKEIAILTDNMTQSTAELTAATFKKFHMAKVVGVTTRGWGTIENTYLMETEIDPEEKYLLLLVNAITIRDDGAPVEGRGVDPDVDTSKANWQKELPKYFKSESLISTIKSILK